MLRIGLTGNIASGKSAVVDIWRKLGAHVIDADVLAREAMAEGTPGHARVLEAFGTVDRTELRDIVFRDPARRRELEEIIHPEVARLRAVREAAFEADGAHVVVNDIPLLFETGLHDEMDMVVLVDAPRDVRIERIVRNRNIERDEAERMVDAQMPSDPKRNVATFIIDNTGSLQELKAQAEDVWRQIAERAYE
jgi:dephospho-CoA kinase